MSKYGTALQSYNNDLVKGIEGLRIRKGKLQTELLEEEKVRDRLQSQIDELSVQLQDVKRRIESKAARLKSYEDQITTTEGAFVKILESSQGLLEVLKRYSKEDEVTGEVPQETIQDGTR